MQLRPLPPDLEFPLLQRTPEDLSFSFAVKRAALGRYVEQRWGWDDHYQLAVHQLHFEEKRFFAIERERKRVGTVSVFEVNEGVRFGEFYLLPAEQGSGLGTRILKHCLEIADTSGLPVRLEYLKWNPVGSLYKRHGFVVTGETDIHFLMERPPYGRSDQHPVR